jgi:hypothetical protein
MARCEGPPAPVGVCHCLACQRRTGSAFAAQARFTRDNVVITGESKEYVRMSDDGTRRVFRFCPECGATVWYTIEEEPELVGIPLGAFADPKFPAPAYSANEAYRHAWVAMPESCKRFD